MWEKSPNRRRRMPCATIPRTASDSWWTGGMMQAPDIRLFHYTGDLLCAAYWPVKEERSRYLDQPLVRYPCIYNPGYRKDVLDLYRLHVPVLRDWGCVGYSTGDEYHMIRGREKRYVYDCLNAEAGHYLGFTDTVSREIPSTRAAVYALLPYRVNAVEVKLAPATVAAGESLHYKIRVRPEDDAAPDAHVVRLELLNPDGEEVEYYARNHLCPVGTVSADLSTALNEQIGTWTLLARDVASGTETRQTFLVREP